MIEKKINIEKLSVENKILSLFSRKPIVTSSEKWSDSNGVYCLANIKKYVDGDNLKIDQIFAEMLENKKIKFIKVKNLIFNETYPFYYHEDYTTIEDAETYKNIMEQSQKEYIKQSQQKEE
jgi:predicted MPP superfamily phosphohydrolase